MILKRLEGAKKNEFQLIYTPANIFINNCIVIFYKSMACTIYNDTPGTFVKKG